MDQTAKAMLADVLQKIVAQTWNEWGAGFGHNGSPALAQAFLYDQLRTTLMVSGIDIPERSFSDGDELGHVAPGPTEAQIEQAEREVFEGWAEKHFEKLISSGEFKTVVEIREEVAISCGYHSWSSYLDYLATGPKVGREEAYPLEEMNENVSFKFGEQFAEAMLSANRSRTDAWFKNSQLEHKIQLLEEANRGLAGLIQQNHDWLEQSDEDNGSYYAISELRKANTSALEKTPPIFQYQPKAPITVKGFEKSPVVAQHWGEFRETGLLLLVNQILHAFGWCLVLSIEEGKVIAAYPALTSFRGFGDESVTDAYRKISIYMEENAKYLREQAHT